MNRDYPTPPATRIGRNSAACFAVFALIYGMTPEAGLPNGFQQLSLPRGVPL